MISKILKAIGRWFWKAGRQAEKKTETRNTKYSAWSAAVLGWTEKDIYEMPDWAVPLIVEHMLSKNDVLKLDHKGRTLWLNPARSCKLTYVKPGFMA